MRTFFTFQLGLISSLPPSLYLTLKISLLRPHSFTVQLHRRLSLYLMFVIFRFLTATQLVSVKHFSLGQPFA